VHFLFGEKEITLARLLINEDGPISSKKLASKINVSSRSIRNYVKHLNDTSEKGVIVSTANGYVGIKKNLQKLIEEYSFNPTPQNYAERVDYILKKVLFNHEELNIFDLSNELYVSDSTIRADIIRINEEYANENVSFFIDADTLKVSGNEKQLRKLMSKFILEQSTSNYLELQKIQDNFRYIDISNLYKILNEVFNSEDYYVNEFSKMNMILHIAILIDRVKNKQIITKDYSLEKSEVLDEEINLTEILLERIQNSFEVEFNQYETLELLYVIKSNVNFLSSINKNTFDNRTKDGFFEYVNKVLNDVFEDYGIRLNNNYFLQPFLLHLSNLYFRAQKRSYTKNAIFKNIKHENPLIFDIAVYISMKITSYLEIPFISEEEISYITLHVGAEINRQKSAKSKIRTIIIYPDYLNLGSRLYNRILYRFEKEIEILDIVNSYNEVHKFEMLDLIITTIPDQGETSIESVVVSPLDEDLLFKAMYEKIYELNNKKNKQFLFENIDKYISDQHFMNNLSKKTQGKYSLLRKMTDQLTKYSITSESFFSNVEKREQSSSTAFGQLAIPHSIEMDAFKTKIAVGVDEEGFKWDEDNKVKIVLLIAINKSDIDAFRILYEALINLFEDSFVVDYLSNSKSGEDFKKKMRNILE
jgi:lichenan operon transcriptional antiterminator